MRASRWAVRIGAGLLATALAGALLIEATALAVDDQPVISGAAFVAAGACVGLALCGFARSAIRQQEAERRVQERRDVGWLLGSGNERGGAS